MPVAIPGAGEPGLVGQLVPGQPAEVEVQQAGQRLAVGADRLGRFTLTPPATGHRPPAPSPGRPTPPDQKHGGRVGLCAGY
jgi:hypothetical protein